MDVELVRWPDEATRLSELRRRGVPRLVLVDQQSSPPLTADRHEDWVRLPATDEDVRHRVLVLRSRADEHGRLPDLDADGLLHVGQQRVALAPIEERLVRVLLVHFGAVVGREPLTRAAWPDQRPDRNVLDVRVARLRPRLATVGLHLQTVRSRGYLLEFDGA